jgi:25S rRNA (uracil2843-N3)-methyltransferase
LNIFRDSFSERFNPDLPDVLQQIKGHLYNRNFLQAFGRDEYLEVYAARWSPSRALGYLQIFHDVTGVILKNEELGCTTQREIRIACLGGGAGAEIVSLAGTLHLHLQTRKNPSSVVGFKDTEPNDQSNQEPQQPSLRFVVTFVDIANWDQIAQKLYTSLTNPPPLSAYASASAKAANKPLVPQTALEAVFKQHDVLNLSLESISGVLENQDLVTILFTLNELCTTSLAKTQAFLLRLTKSVTPGVLLLVVDSAGSYSTVSLNGKEKKYPMHWLLDHTLLRHAKSSTKDATADADGEAEARKEEVPMWEKLREEESTWFRVPAGLKYPLELENMRFQLHLYRRL